MIFFVLSEKMGVLFPENMILSFRRKIKDDIFSKNIWKYDIFFKCSKKIVFPKKIAPKYDPSCIFWNDGISFPKI